MEHKARSFLEVSVFHAIHQPSFRKVFSAISTRLKPRRATRGLSAESSSLAFHLVLFGHKLDGRMVCEDGSWDLRCACDRCSSVPICVGMEDLKMASHMSFRGSVEAVQSYCNSNLVYYTISACFTTTTTITNTKPLSNSRERMLYGIIPMTINFLEAFYMPETPKVNRDL